jgi:putative ABC transport system ATP-binding protein
MEDVYKSYFLSNQEEIPVLKWVFLNVKKWEFVSLMWESWSWKSTLLNIIWFLHPMSKWAYFFQWENISSFKDNDTLSFIRNKKIWFIFQQYFLLPRLTALENVILPSIYASIDIWIRKQKAEEILVKVWLKDKMKNKPSELSWWQQQRVAIARSLINDPDILLADEPTWALDHNTSEEIMELLTSLNKQWKTILMVTHTAAVAKYTSRIIYLKEWKVENCDYKL